MIVVRSLIAAVLLASSAACSSGLAPAASVAPPAAAVQPQQPAVARTAEKVVGELAGRIGTAKATVVLTAETDPNQLLGRPNGYTSKASFTDSRSECLLPPRCSAILSRAVELR